MTTIAQFIKEHSTPFIAVNTIFNNDTKKKEMKYLVKNYNVITYSESFDNFKKFKEEKKKFNQILFKVPKTILIFDTDTQESYDTLLTYLNKNNKYDEDNVTDSYSCREHNQQYKKHFYFKLDPGELDKINKIIPNKSINTCGLDIFRDVWGIAEYKNATLNFELLDYIDVDNITDILKIFNINTNIKINNIIENKPIVTTATDTDNTELFIILDGLNRDRWNNYEDWWKIYCVFLNSNIDINIFKQYSKKYSNKYDEQNNERVLKTFKPVNKTIKKNALKMASLYEWLKIDNIDIFNELKKNKPEVLNSYENIKKEFELRHFKIRVPLFYVEESQYENALIIREDKEFEKVYKNFFYTATDEKKEKFVPVWMDDELNRTYEKMDFIPYGKPADHIYNLFNGFNGETFELVDEDLENSLIMQFIKNVICKRDEKIFLFLSKWIANMFQDTRKSDVALILKSGQGCGKDTFIDILQILIGSKHSDRYNSPEGVFTKFNSEMANKILVVLNEAVAKDNKELMGMIKGQITTNKEGTITIEKKGKDRFAVADHINYIFMTNSENCLVIEADDRRFAVLEISEEFKQNGDYFTLLRKEMTDGNYTRAIFNYFKNLDIGDYKFAKERPMSDSYKYMRDMNTSCVALFFEDFINDEARKTNPETDPKVGSTNLFNKFKEFIMNGNFKYDISIRKFCLDIMKYDGIEKSNTRSGNGYKIDIPILKTHLTQKYKIEFID